MAEVVALRVTLDGREAGVLRVQPGSTLGEVRELAAALVGQAVDLVDFHAGLSGLTCDEAGLASGSELAAMVPEGDAAGDAGTCDSTAAIGDAQCADRAKAKAAAGVAASGSSDTKAAMGDARSVGRANARGAAHSAPKEAPFAVRRALEDASLVTDWLVVGGSLVAGSREALAALDVGFVLNCCERLKCASRAVRSLVLPLRDIRSESLAPHLPAAFAFLAEARASGRRCLLHCMTGASRSVSVALAFLVSEGQSLAEVWFGDSCLSTSTRAATSGLY